MSNQLYGTIKTDVVYNQLTINNSYSFVISGYNANIIKLY